MFIILAIICDLIMIVLVIADIITGTMESPWLLLIWVFNCLLCHISLLISESNENKDIL